MAVFLVACMAREAIPSHAASRLGSWHFCTITFGAVLPVTGDATGEGRLRHAYDLVRRRLNRSGGFDIGGKRCLVEVIYDDHSDSRSAANQVHDLVTGRAVHFVLGGPTTETGSAVLTVSERYGVPMLEGSLPSEAALASVDIAMCGTGGDRAADDTLTLDGCLSQQLSAAATRLYAFQQAIQAAGSIDPSAVREELIRLGAVDQ